MVHAHKDTKLESILAEIKASGPTAKLKYVLCHLLENYLGLFLCVVKEFVSGVMYWNEEDVLKKLRKPMKSMGDVEVNLCLNLTLS